MNRFVIIILGLAALLAFGSCDDKAKKKCAEQEQAAQEKEHRERKW